MKLLTKALEKKLLANGVASTIELGDGNYPDPKPVVKLFNPCGGQTWLLSELSADGDRAYGLCDLGFGTPELGYLSLAELGAIRTRPFGLGIERDLHATFDKPMSEYAREARERGHIIA